MEFSLYQPHSNQVKIHKSRVRNRVVVAGRRFGKSALGLNEALARAFQIKGQIIWIILPMFRQAKEIYWIDPDITRYFIPYVQAGLIKMDKSELSLNILPTNSWVRLKGSDNYDSLRGAGLDLIIWDEVGDTKEEAFETIKPALADSPDHRQLYIGTPKGLNHFHDFALRGDQENIIPDFGKPIKPHKDWFTWHFTSYDNATWPEGSRERKLFVEYIDQQREEAEEKGRLGFWQQEYMASFEESAGRFFPKWFYKTHVYVGSIAPRPEFRVFETTDWGRSAPFAWYAHVLYPTEFEIDGEFVKFNRIFTFAELYGTERSPDEWAQEIVKVRKRYRYDQPHRIYCDPSMLDRLSDGSQSIADQMNVGFERITGKRGVFAGGSKNRKKRWATMDNWIRDAIDGLPYWMITSDCPNLIRTIPLMQPKENDIEDLNTDLEDHGCLGGETPILTHRGMLPIVDVTTEDKVWTPLGWSEVLWSGQTGIDTLIICHGMRITRNHPVLTQDGFLPSRDLSEESRLWSVFTSKGSHTEDIQIQQTIPIRSILGVAQRRVEATRDRYTNTYGNILGGRFPKAIKFTILMATHLTTLYLILRFSLIPDIKKAIGRKTTISASKLAGKILPKLYRRLLNGTEAKRAERGTKKTAREFGINDNTSQKSVTSPNAVANLQQNNTSRDSVVKTTKWLNTGEIDKVYNLKTANGMFTANGVVVSNCDSVSYGLPFIKWIDSEVGAVARKKVAPSIPGVTHVDPSKFR